jgi:POT family proton-dependent oligopeptide transporter
LGLHEKKSLVSSSIIKIGVGISIMGLGFIFMFFASVESEIFGKSSMYWLVLAYLFHTIGELCASPVILSYITKLSPKKIVASIMGIYFAAIGLGNKLAGTIGQSSEDFSEKNVFLGITIICIIVGLILIFLNKKLKKLSHGIDN